MKILRCERKTKKEKEKKDKQELGEREIVGGKRERELWVREERKRGQRVDRESTERAHRRGDSVYVREREIEE